MNDSPSTARTPGVERRTLVAGAAWTIPVVATAVGAPLAAASGAPTLAFTNGPYTVAACGTLKDVVLKATTNGTAPVAIGTPLTVSLPAGLVWSDGTTGSRTVRTGADGEVVLSGIRSTSGNTALQLSAAAGAATTTAPVSIAARSGDGVHALNYTTRVDSLRPNSADALRILGDTASGFLIWQDRNGDIRDGNGNPVITDADTGPGLLAMNRGGAGGANALIWYKKDGVLHYFDYTTKADQVRANSADAIRILSDTASGFLVWQDANGDIRDGSGNPLITGADTGAGLLVMNRGGAGGNDPLIWYKKADGVHYYNYTSKVDTLRPDSTEAVRIVGDTATGFLIWQDADGDIRDGNGNPLVTGADTGSGLLAMNRAGNDPVIWYKKTQPCA